MSNREKEALIILEAAIEKFDNNESLYIPVEDAKILRDLIKNQENKIEILEINSRENQEINIKQKQTEILEKFVIELKNKQSCGISFASSVLTSDIDETFKEMEKMIKEN